MSIINDLAWENENNIPKEEPKSSCPKCRTTDFDNCHSIQCPMRKEDHKQENCCTPIGQIKRYKDCIGCDRKPKQENTLEEAAIDSKKRYINETAKTISYREFIEGAKWQQERMCLEADKIMKFLDTEVELKLSDAKTIERIKWYFETYFEQFKKK